MVLADVDVPDVAAVESGFVRDGSDDVPRLHSVSVAHFDAESLLLRAVRA